MERWFYVYAGLNVASAIEIPEWRSFEQPPCEPDVSFVFGDQVASEDDPINPEEYRFTVPDVGQFRICEGREIAITPVPGVEQNDIRLFLLGSAWGALCYQRGMLVFHASAVRVGDEAVMFCAPSDRGKTTLAAWLSKLGYSLVSEDLCNIDLPAQGRPMIYPATPRLKLWEDALGALDLHNNKREQCRFRPEKYYLEWQGHNRPLPLRAIYVLEWGDLGIKRLAGQEALARLLTAATYFNGDELEAMGQLETYTQQCLALVGRVPVFEFKRPRDLSVMDETVDFLKNHWPGSD
jgi:hypothetical protein